MNLKEFLRKHPATDNKGFGLFVKQRREELGISLDEFEELSEIYKPFLIDIENCQREAPLNYLGVYQYILQIPNTEADLFLDLAYCSRLNHPDINQYLSRTPKARELLRLAISKDFSDEEFSNILSTIAKNNKTEDAELENY